MRLRKCSIPNHPKTLSEAALSVSKMVGNEAEQQMPDPPIAKPEEIGNDD